MVLRGSPDIATARAKKVAGCLRTPNGWDDVHVTRPEGGNEKTYVALDRPTREVQCDRHVKMLKEALGRGAPGKTFAPIKREGALTHWWRMVAKLEGGNSDQIKWLDAADDYEINKEAAQTAFNDILQATSRHAFRS